MLIVAFFEKENMLRIEKANYYFKSAEQNVLAYPQPDDIHKAVRDLKKAIALNPNLLDAYKLLIQVYENSFGIKESEDIKIYLQKMLEIDPNNKFAKERINDL